MTESKPSPICVRSSGSNDHRPISRCDTPSLVTSSSKFPTFHGISSSNFDHVVRSSGSGEQSADAESTTNAGKFYTPGKKKNSRQFQRWTPEEDRQLKEGVQSGDGPPYDWKTIAADHLDGTRSPTQCKARWKNALSPDINRDPFSVEEDNAILNYRQRGWGWSTIAAQLPGRIAEQVRDRFVNYIDPSLEARPWTKEDDDLLSELQVKHGNKWAYISMRMPGRSETSIKNRWHNRKTQQRRAMRRAHARSRSNHTERPHNIDAAHNQGSQELCTVKVEDMEQDVANGDSKYSTVKVEDTHHGVCEI